MNSQSCKQHTLVASKNIRWNAHVIIFVALLISMTGVSRVVAAPHEVSVTLNGLDAVTETLLPVYVEYDCYGQDRDALYAILPEYLEEAACYSFKSAPMQITQEVPEYECKPVQTQSDINVPVELQGVIKNQYPDTKVGDLQEPKDIDCKQVSTTTQFWNPRFHCRDWTAFYTVHGYVPVRKNSLTAEFQNNSTVHLDADLNDANISVTLLLVGKRVNTTACHIVHPFNEEINYSVDIDVAGFGGVFDVVMDADTDNSTLQVKKVKKSTLDIDINNDAFSYDTATNNVLVEINEALSLGLKLTVQAIDWIFGVDVFDVVRDLVITLIVDDPCTVTKDCLSVLAEQLIKDNLSAIVDGINAAVTTPLTLHQHVGEIDSGSIPVNVNGTTVVNRVKLEIDDQLTGIQSSATDNTCTADWNVNMRRVDNNLGSCNAGITGFNIANPASVTALNGDMVVNLPFDLVGDTAYEILRQLNFCNVTYNLGTISGAGALTGNISLNGAVTVGKGGRKRVDLRIPATFAAADPNSTGVFNFNIELRTEPSISNSGDFSLLLKKTLISNTSGTINTTGPGGVAVVYNFSPTGATVSVAGSPPVGAPNIQPAIEATVNANIAPFFPIPLAQRATPYVVPHVYIQADDAQVDNSSLSVSANIKDGSDNADLRVVGVQGATPYVDARVDGQRMRTIPLNIEVKNRESWNVLPPADIVVNIDGVDMQRLWSPPIEAGDTALLPLTLQVPVRLSGEVTGETSITIKADPTQSTIIDSNRDNNTYAFTIDNAWFEKDYEVEIGNVSSMIEIPYNFNDPLMQYEVNEADLTIPVTVRNVGFAAGSANNLNRMNVFVNGVMYGGVFVEGDLQVGAETTYTFNVHVDDGPDINCDYHVEVVIEVSDAKTSNNDDARIAHIDNTRVANCANGPGTQFIDEDVLDDKFEGLNQVEYGTEHGGVDTGPNAPIFDHINE